MARPLRLSFENAVYHITARGNRKENIFRSKRDRYVFLEKMQETFQKYSFTCYAYCLMDNHYHLFLKTIFPNISEGLHYLNASYANWFRVKYQLSGSIFQGRFKSMIVDEDSYAVTLSGYIHLNPLRAGLVDDLRKYPWSSFLDYIGARKLSIENIDTSLILDQFGRDLRDARKRYYDFVIRNANMINPLKDSFKGVAIGSDEFVEEIKERIKSIGRDREIKETKILDGYMPDEIIEALVRCFKIEKDDVYRKKRGEIYRPMALYLIKKYTPLSLKEIGELFEMDYSAVSYAAKRFNSKVERDKKIAKMVNTVIQAIESGEMSKVET